MKRAKEKAFFVCFLLSASITGSVLYLSLLQRWLQRGWPWLFDLFQKPGGVGAIAALVLWLNLWVILFLLVRWARTGRERNLLNIAAGQVSALHGLPDLDRHLSRSLTDVSRGVYNESQLKVRLELWRSRLLDFNRSDRLSFLMMGQAGIESAYIESIYGPLRALVWALPGLGFMGTAMEMSEAIKKVGDVGQGNTEKLLQSLTTGVIPALAGAFQITLFALGSSVVCFLLLSLAHRREEKVLDGADALSLQLLSKVQDDQPSLLLNDDNSRYLATGLRDLRTVLQVLAYEIEKLQSVIPSLDVPDTDHDENEESSYGPTGGWR